MSKPIERWMPITIGIWETNTGQLTNEQSGAYLRLCMWYWVNGPLPDDDEQLANIVRDNRRWKSLRPKLQKFFTVADGRWVHVYLESELAKAAAISIKRKEVGAGGAAKRWGTVVPLRGDGQ